LKQGLLFGLHAPLSLNKTDGREGNLPAGDVSVLGASEWLPCSQGFFCEDANQKGWMFFGVFLQSSRKATRSRVPAAKMWADVEIS
jgi:hypothetical protein